MTVIAYDGKTVAADKQCVNGSTKSTTTKLIRLDSGMIVGMTGTLSSGLLVLDWLNGKLSEWPKCQEDKDRWAMVIVIKDGVVKVYEQNPAPVLIKDEFMAWGSGGDFAIGAMAMGATAKESVEIANRFSTDCGMGIDVFEVL